MSTTLEKAIGHAAEMREAAEQVAAKKARGENVTSAELQICRAVGWDDKELAVEVSRQREIEQNQRAAGFGGGLAKAEQARDKAKEFEADRLPKLEAEKKKIEDRLRAIDVEKRQIEHATGNAQQRVDQMLTARRMLRALAPADVKAGAQQSLKELAGTVRKRIDAIGAELEFARTVAETDAEAKRRNYVVARPGKDPEVIRAFRTRLPAGHPLYPFYKATDRQLGKVPKIEGEPLPDDEMDSLAWRSFVAEQAAKVKPLEDERAELWTEYNQREAEINATLEVYFLED